MRFIVAMSIILLSTQTSYGNSSLEDEHPAFHTICKNVEILSREIMMSRQVGMSKDRLTEILHEHDYEELDSVIEDAYNRPRLKSPTEDKILELSWKFGDKYYNICMKNLISQQFDPFEI